MISKDNLASFFGYAKLENIRNEIKINFFYDFLLDICVILKLIFHQLLRYVILYDNYQHKRFIEIVDKSW